jgi:hypothetical protein
MIFHYCTALLSISFLLLPQAIAMAQRANPVALQPCIQQLKTKRIPIKTVFVNGTYQKGAKTYYLANLFPSKPDLDISDAIFSVSLSGCQVLTQYHSGNPIPVTASIPLAVARGLTLSFEKSVVSKFGGPQKYQSFLNTAAQDTGRLYLDPNEAWALHQLGIRIPRSIKIISP